MIQVVPLMGDALISASVRRRLGLHQTAGVQTPGGKYGRQSLHLGLFVPSEFERFFEPFAGGLNMTTHLIKQGWVTATQCHASETCVPLADFHRVIQSHECERMVGDLLAMEQIHGRGNPHLFEGALADIASGDHFLRARGFFVHNRMCQDGIRVFDRPSLFSEVHTQEKGLRSRHILRLPLYGAVQAGMHLRCGDYRPLLHEAARHGSSAFLFSDPPYPVEEGKARYDETLYGAQFDHDAFIDEVKEAARHNLVMITLNDIRRNREAFTGWNIMIRQTYYGASRRHGAELVIMNYAPPGQDNHMRRLGWERVTTTSVSVVGMQRRRATTTRSIPTTTPQDALIAAIRTANLLNGRANRKPTVAVVKNATREAERVNEMFGELHIADQFLFRLPDPDDKCVPAYSVEYVRYFPIRIPQDSAEIRCASS